MFRYRDRIFGERTRMSADNDGQMTIQALYHKINRCLQRLTKAAVPDPAVFDLEIVVTQLRIRLHAGIYDPFKLFDQQQLPHVSRLVALSDELAEAPVRDDRATLVTELADLAKAVLRHEGVPFYS